jgi:hypothetical protein
MPQWFTSVWRSRQTPPQLSRPAPHETVQVPREQTVPEGQALPHVPQLLLSVARSRHTPAQLFVPAPHETEHMPAEHT